MSEREALEKEQAELEARLEAVQEKLRPFEVAEQEGVEARVKRADSQPGDFKPEELVFSAYSRCDCGAGLAYPKHVGAHGAWDCADILMGTAKPKGHPESKMHTGRMPFIFYEVKSENQPSVNGATTRPK